MKKHIFLFLSMYALLCCGCERHRHARPKLFLDNIVKNYLIFQINSFWVYENTQSTEKDTVKVVENKLWGTADTRIPHDYEVNDATLFSSYMSKYIYQQCEARDSDKGLSNYNMWFEGARTSTKCTFFSNRSVGSTYNYWFYPDNVVTYQEFLPTYMLEGKTYSEVMVFESRYTGASLAFDDVRLPVRVWYAKHVGIIRKEMRNGDFWNLISHDVKQ